MYAILSKYVFLRLIPFDAVEKCVCSVFFLFSFIIKIKDLLISTITLQLHYKFSPGNALIKCKRNDICMHIFLYTYLIYMLYICWCVRYN